MRLFYACAFAAIALFAAAGCGSSPEATVEETVDAGPVAAASGAWDRMREAAGPDSDRLLIPEGPEPEKVLVRRLHSGHGPALQEDDVYNASWVYFDYTTGKLRQDSDDSAPEYFTYTPGTTIKAWWPGLQEMRVGERRELVVPSDWAYKSGARVYLVELNLIKPK